MRTYKIYCLSNFQIYSAVLTVDTMLYIISADFAYLFIYNQKCVPFDHLHPFCQPSPLASGNHQTVLCNFEISF